MYSVKPLCSTEADSARLIDFQNQLYKNDPFYRTSDPRTCIYENVLYMVQKNGEPVGFAAGIINPALNYNEEPAGCIGFVECSNDTLAATMLFDTIEKWLLERGKRWCIGPLNGDTWHSYRVSEPDDNHPFFLDNYHKPWYGDMFRKAGYESAATYRSTIAPPQTDTAIRCNRFSSIFADRGIITRPISLEHFDEEVSGIHSLCISAFSNNFLYTPASRDEILPMYQALKSVINPQFVMVCEDARNDLLAFIFCIDDLYNNKKKGLIIKTVAVKPVAKARGLGTYLVEKAHLLAGSQGYDYVIHALMHDQNISTQIANESSAIHRRYTLFGKRLL